MKLKIGDRVLIKPTDQVGTIIRITDNPFLPDWLSMDYYHVIPDGQNDHSNYACCRKRQLKKIETLEDKFLNMELP